MPQVLVIDDDVGLREAVFEGLHADGAHVVCVVDGPSGLREALTGTFDAIVMDLVLAGMSGQQLLRQVRAHGIDTPVLVVSALGAETTQVGGFDAGADAYLVKPVSMLVLLAHIRALLRRRTTILAEVEQARVGKLIVDPVSRQASWAGHPVALSKREFALLYTLASHPDSLRSKDELLATVWGGHQAATHNAVEVYISYLRRKLAAAGAQNLIHTVHGKGYRLHPPA